MSHLLDTDISIHWMRGHPNVVKHVSSVGWSDTAISVITAAELLYGAYNANRPTVELGKVEGFIAVCRVLPLEMAALHHHGELKATLKRRGERLDDLDLLIASAALAGDHILVTNNMKHYARIPGLKLENWLTP